MKSALAVVLFRLFTIGVFIDGKETSNGELVSVTEGDSVTLKSGVTDIQTDDEIEWRFNGKIKIATISKHSSKISLWVKPDGSFRDRLQLDSQTGDLKISNIRTTDSGQYKPTFSSPGGSPPEMTFTVDVVSADAGKSVSVLEGDSVTLRTDPTYIQRYDVIRWRFDHQNSPIAEIDRTAGIFNTFDGPDGRFRHRLKLNNQTGSLIITNTRTTDSGEYEVEISSTSNRYTIHHTQSFSVTVSDAVKSESVKEGDSVILPTTTEIQKDDLILWMFGSIRLAEINKTEQRFHIYDGPDERFRGRLKLDHQTGSLIITNTRATDPKDYVLKIISSRCTILRRITVTVTATDINTAYIPHGTTSSNNYSATDINTAYIPHGTTSSNNYSAVPDSGLSPGAVAGIVVAVILVTAAVVAAFEMYFRCKSSKLERQSAVAGIAVAVCVILVAAAVIAAVVMYYRRRNSSELERQSAVAMIGVAVGGLVAAVVVAVVINYRRCNSSELGRQNVNGQNRTSNGTPDPDDHANEGTELTNA